MLTDPAEFYAHLLEHMVEHLHGDVAPTMHHAGTRAPLHLQLAADGSAEGTRLVGAARFGSAMTMYLGLRPNYETAVYTGCHRTRRWVVAADHLRAGSRAAAVGAPQAAAAGGILPERMRAQRLGLEPQNHAGMSRNPLWQRDGQALRRSI